MGHADANEALNYMYDDGVKQVKINRAIAGGLITKRIDPGNIVRYTLTKQGSLVYRMETSFNDIFGKGL